MTPDDLDLMQLARTGELLTTVDDTDYRRVSVVFAWPRDGVPTVYCRAEDWSHTPAARLAAKDREIAELGETLERWAAETLAQTQRASAAEARVKELEQQLAAPPETPVQNQEKMFQAQAAALDAPDPVPCPDCGAVFKNERALRMHIQRAHQGMVAIKKAPPLQFVEELGWHCAAKGCAGSHARDLHDTDFCTLHAQRQLTNGVEATA